MKRILRALHHDCTGFPQTCAACTYQKQRDEAIALLRDALSRIPEFAEHSGFKQRAREYLEGGDGA